MIYSPPIAFSAGGEEKREKKGDKITICSVHSCVCKSDVTTARSAADNDEAANGAIASTCPAADASAHFRSEPDQKEKKNERRVVLLFYFQKTEKIAKRNCYASCKSSFCVCVCVV